MRTDYISWDEYFMGVALLSAKRSKDPSTQVGACIVNEDKRIVGIGYNGFPRGCEDKIFPWEREGKFLTTKYAYVVHAEVNAILNSSSNLNGATLYVSLFPCNECAKVIIQSGIRRRRVKPWAILIDMRLLGLEIHGWNPMLIMAGMLISGFPVQMD